MTTLDDFSNGEPPDPDETPRCRLVSSVSNPHNPRETTGKTVIVENRGPEGGEVRGYLSTRSIDDNLFRKYDSYPISDVILDRLEREDTEVVLIAADEDSRDLTVYEFRLDQYLTAPVFVWDREVGGESVEDRQRCPGRNDAINEFEGVDISDLYRDSDTTP